MSSDLGMEQEKRTARAFSEEMAFTKAPNGWVVQTGRGAYLVTEKGTCTCGDYQWRCAGTLLRCKHTVALRHHLLETGGKLGPDDGAICEGCGEVLPARQTKVQPSGERLCRHCEPIVEAVTCEELAPGVREARDAALARWLDE